MKYVIKINSKCESRAVQEHAFKLGAAWTSSGTSYYNIPGKEDSICIDAGCMYAMPEQLYKPSITVDEFLALKTLEPEKPFEFSDGEYRVFYGGVMYDPSVLKWEAKEGWRFDTQEEAERAHKAVLEALADQQRLCWEETRGGNK